MVFEKVGHQGTYNAMPTTCVAGIATLEIIRTTDACDRANRYVRSLQEALHRVFADEGVNWISYGTFCGIHVCLNGKNHRNRRDDIYSCRFDYATIKAPVTSDLPMKLRVGLLLHGVDTQPWPGAPISPRAHR